ncbi:MAG: PLD nuclease N-terminal domain-containing protein [Flavobacteriales bacterium]|nr:PLD nuclease N-terminal domain-containing protein [Flavobacteriales bacterium]
MAFLIVYIFIGIIALAIFAIWIKTIVEIVQSDFEGDNKLIWLLIVLFVGWVGLILYYTMGRQKRILATNKEQKFSEEVFEENPRYQK